MSLSFMDWVSIYVFCYTTLSLSAIILAMDGMGARHRRNGFSSVPLGPIGTCINAVLLLIQIVCLIVCFCSAPISLGSFVLALIHLVGPIFVAALVTKGVQEWRKQRAWQKRVMTETA